MKKRRWLTCLLVSALLVTGLLSGCGQQQKLAITGASSSTTNKETIGVGFQIPTAQTWGVLIVKHQKLFEKYLAEVAPDKEFEINWMNSASGPPLTNNMVAGKLQIALMGDMPILINGEQGQTGKNYKSVFLAFDGKGKDGHNQAIMVPKDSQAKSLEDLQGQTISVPLGSSAHRMLLEALDKRGLADKVNIVSQDVTVGMTNIEQNKVAAHATWEPYPSLILEKNSGNTLLDGSDTKSDYLDGVVADRNWAEKNPDYATAFLKALVEAHDFIRQHPEEASQIFAEETKYPLEVTRLIVNNVRFDSVIYERDIKSLGASRDFLKKIDKLKNIDLENFVDDKYLRDAFNQLGKTYPSENELKGEWLSLQ